VIVVRQQLTSVNGRVAFAPPKTASGEGRLVELESGTLGTLLALRLAQDAERAALGEAYQDGGLVFAREDGRPYDPDHVTKTFRRLAVAAGLRPVRLHDLRHGAASLRLAAGVPIELVSKVLGHSSIAITANTYSHLLPGVARQAAEAAAALVPRTPRAHIVTTSGRESRGAPDQEGISAGQQGAGEGTRTPNHLFTRQVRCRLRHAGDANARRCDRPVRASPE
jgi:Phage integrase family